jgi:hypothetical protein
VEWLKVKALRSSPNMEKREKERKKVARLEGRKERRKERKRKRKKGKERKERNIEGKKTTNVGENMWEKEPSYIN